MSNRLLSFGPALVAVLLLAVIWQQISSGLLFWIVLAAVTAVAGTYYLALFRALIRQRERHYERTVRPILSSEYKNG